jgi:DNA-binding CsgD family transcriptional regulator
MIAVSGWDDLSVREREILARVAAGMTNREIAAELHLGADTVKHHLSRSMAKLGVRNRTQAAVIAIDSKSETVRDVTARLRDARP